MGLLSVGADALPVGLAGIWVLVKAVRPVAGFEDDRFVVVACHCSPAACEGFRQVARVKACHGGRA